MRWILVMLLFANALFFAWIYTGSVNRDGINSEFSIGRGGGDGAGGELVLLEEMRELPPPRNSGNWIPPNQEWDDEEQEQAAAEEEISQGRIEESGVTEYEQDASILMPQDWLVEETTCYSFGPIFSDKDTSSLQDYLAKYEIPHNSRLEEGVEAYYGVYLQPEKNVIALAELVERLNARGVDNYRLVSSGELRNNLSLGVYTTREEVDARMSELKEKGFEPIVVPRRSDSAVWLNMLVSPQIQDADFLKPLLNRDDRFVIECEEAGLSESQG